MLPELATRHVHIHSIATDDQGLSAEALRTALENWDKDEKTKAHAFPKAVYTVPTGGNPAGTTASADRKRAVLQLAREHSVLILEDDPYYFLTFANVDEDPATYEYTPSYFRLECEGADQWGYGYVLRLESFSKIMSAGMRLGFMMGPPTLVNAVISNTASSNLHASAPPQAMAAVLLHHWGVDGFLRHVNSVSRMYRDRRDMFGTKLQNELGRGADGTQAPLASWVTPVAGMFYWIKLHLPPVDGAPEGDSFQVISEKAVAHGVLAVPGSSFFGTPTTSPYVRVSYSLIEEADAEEALRRLRLAVESAWKDAGYDKIPPMP